MSIECKGECCLETEVPSHPVQTKHVIHRSARCTQSVSLLKTQIERIVEPTFRRTRHAQFQKPNGWYICDAWFEDGSPRMQIRSGVDSLEDAAIVATGIQMAIDWLVEETARGGNLPVLATAERQEP